MIGFLIGLLTVDDGAGLSGIDFSGAHSAPEKGKPAPAWLWRRGD